MAQELNTNLYSRQLGTFGLSTMRSLVKTVVAIHGLRGLGSEIAKNLILSGPAKVSIYDPGFVEIRDISSNCFLRETDVGVRSRAAASVSRLRALNSYVEVEELLTFDCDSLDGFDVVVVTTGRPELVETIDDYCRNRGKGFIYSESLGAAGFAFVDFGPNFQMTNRNGQDPSVFVIDRVDESGAVSFLGDKSHELREGDTILVTGLHGAEELNGKEWKVREVVDSQCVEIDLPEGLTVSAYVSGGIATEVKKPVTIPFKSWAENCRQPEFAPAAYCHDKKPNGATRQLHLACCAVREFQRKHQRLPAVLSDAEAQECLSLAQALNAEHHFVETINEEYPTLLGKSAALEAAPFVTFWGGIVAQEVIKFTGSYRPLSQFIYNDWLALLKCPGDRAETGDRYSDQSALLGRDLTERLKKMNLFVVGAGALGCEYLKLLALMGGACGGGHLDVTDDDHIELSNLSRQFLFHHEHIGQSKSAVACSSAQQMNPALAATPHQERVCAQTESLYTDQFWESLSVVISAVDNVKARKYLDEQCLWYEKPFMESGTKGLNGSSMVVLPRQTKSYNDLEISDDKQTVANCTLKRFPYMVEHCVEWARNMFDYYFCEGPREAQKFLSSPEQYLQAIAESLNRHDQRLRLEQIRTVLECAQSRSFEVCVQKARDVFQAQFHNEIRQLLNALPPGHKTQDGRDFWTSPKRMPHPLDFDQGKEGILDLLCAGANLYAQVIGIPQTTDRNLVQQLAANTAAVPFQPITAVIDTNESAPISESYSDDEQYIQTMRTAKFTVSAPLVPLEFEKDDDSNCHIDFIHALGSLRSDNYDIPSVTKLKTKLLAGKIIPAVTTSGATITGAVMIELCKVIRALPRDDLRGWYFDLGTNYYVVTKPSVPIPIEAIKGDKSSTFTSWDKLSLAGPLSLREFVSAVESPQGLHLSMACYGTAIIYGFSTPTEEQWQELMESLVEKSSGEKIPQWKTCLKFEVMCKNADGVTVNVPTLKYRLKRE